MLFNSVFFIVVFLPAALFLYFQMARISKRYALYSMVEFSLVFYGWHNPYNLFLIGFLLCVNYLLLLYITRYEKKIGLIVGIIFNIGVLCYFKYTNFLIGNANSFFAMNLQFKEIVLPLAISFFTFQKMAFLVDVYRKTRRSSSFSRILRFYYLFSPIDCRTYSAAR